MSFLDKLKSRSAEAAAAQRQQRSATVQQAQKPEAPPLGVDEQGRPILAAFVSTGSDSVEVIDRAEYKHAPAGRELTDAQRAGLEAQLMFARRDMACE